MPKQRKIKLQLQASDFVMFAISSVEDDYRLVWLLNKVLEIDLVRAQYPNEQIETTHDQKITYFIYKNAAKKLDFIFIGNKYPKFCLIPQLPTTDFVLKISGNLTDDEADGIAAKIRSVKEISACINLNVKKSSLLGVFERI